jgi:hypothetical protein
MIRFIGNPSLCVETASHPCPQNGSSLCLFLSPSAPSCLTWFYLLRVCITWMGLERHCKQMEQFQNFLPVLLQQLNLLASHKRARKRSSAMVLFACRMGCRWWMTQCHTWRIDQHWSWIICTSSSITWSSGCLVEEITCLHFAAVW